MKKLLLAALFAFIYPSITMADTTNLSVTAPNGGTYQTGSTINIQWTAAGLTSANNSVGLSVYRKSVGSPRPGDLSVAVGNPVSGGQVSSLGNYSWTIPSNTPAGSDYVVYLSSGSSWVESNTFSITPASVATATQPALITTTTACLNLPQNLTYGATDTTTNNNVTALQDFLFKEGILKTNDRGRLGTITRQAVSDFQVKPYLSRGISASSIDSILVPNAQERAKLAANGFALDRISIERVYVGPYTRAKIKALTCGVPTIAAPITTVSCIPGYLFNSVEKRCVAVTDTTNTTTTTTTSSNTADTGCRPGYAFSITTGRACAGVVTSPHEYSGKVIDEQGNGIPGVTLGFHRGGEGVDEATSVTGLDGSWSLRAGTSYPYASLRNKPGYYRGDMTINAPGKQPDFTLTKLKPLYVTPVMLDFVRQKNAMAEFVLHNYDQGNDVTSNNLEYCVSTPQQSCTSFVSLTSQTTSNGFSVRGPGRLTPKVVVSYVGFLDSNIKAAAISIRRKNDPSKVVSVILQVKEAAFTWNELVPVNTMPGLPLGTYSKPLPAGVALCPVGTVDKSSCPYLQHGSHCALDFSVNSYKEFSCELAQSSIPSVVPTANITVNGGQKNITVNTGDMVTKTWGSTNGSSYDATWSAVGTCADNGKTNQHWNGLDNLVSPSTKAKGTSAYPATANQEGCNYAITYTVTASDGKTASDHIIIKHPKPAIAATYTKTTLSSLSDSLSFSVSGFGYDNAQGCLRVLAHPTASAISSATACTSPSEFTYFKNNTNWKWSTATQSWTQTWSNANVPSIFVPGVKVQSRFRDSVTGKTTDGQVVSVNFGKTTNFKIDGGNFMGTYATVDALCAKITPTLGGHSVFLNGEAICAPGELSPPLFLSSLDYMSATTGEPTTNVVTSPVVSSVVASCDASKTLQSVSALQVNLTDTQNKAFSFTPSISTTGFTIGYPDTNILVTISKNACDFTPVESSCWKQGIRGYTLFVYHDGTTPGCQLSAGTPYYLNARTATYSTTAKTFTPSCGAGKTCSFRPY